jgi:DNA-binding transcriptional LysR family regulator
LKETLQS